MSDVMRTALKGGGQIRISIDRWPDGDFHLCVTEFWARLTRMSTSFMSEPSKIYNMVYRDLFDLQQAKSGAARKKAGKALARSTAALIVSFAVNAVAQSIPDT